MPQATPRRNFRDTIGPGLPRSHELHRQLSQKHAGALNDAFFHYQKRLFEAEGDFDKAMSPNFESSTPPPDANSSWPDMNALPEYVKLRKIVEKFSRSALRSVRRWKQWVMQAPRSFTVPEQRAEDDAEQGGNHELAPRAATLPHDSSRSSSEGSDLDDLQDFAPSPEAVSSRRRSSGHLNFVDSVSAGIGSYLARLEEKPKDTTTTVYNRSAGLESSRWRKCLENLSNKYGNQVASRGQAEQDQNDHAARVSLKRPCNGRPAQNELGPCVPPIGLEFEHFPGGDGRPRLSFCSSFESGNLAVAQCDGPDLYTLLVDVDANTDGYTQWFYFAVHGGSTGLKVTFRLINMAKSGSLFGEKGMRPVVWSEKSERGWERGRTEVSYSKSAEVPGKQPLLSGQKQWFTLSFSYIFEFHDDTVFFAYHYPYTYSHLCNFLDALQTHPYAGNLFSRRVLCHTIGGLPCEVLDVDSDADDSRNQKGIAVVTARVHPGESNASWMMHGFISFLLSSAAEAIALRQAWVEIFSGMCQFPMFQIV
eukprot:symbB.v1.2.031418.t1/scaffold3646.1/size68564/3